MNKQLIYQHDINGCGIAVLANLLESDYSTIKSDFENFFYPINRGIKVFDVVKYLETKSFHYETKFINPKKLSDEEGLNIAKTINSITLIRKSNKYPIGHYLLRTKEGWIDPWFNLPSIDNVHAGIREDLPNPAMYVILPKN